MRTFVTGMVFMSVLTAALYWIIIFTGGPLADVGNRAAGCFRKMEAGFMDKYEPNGAWIEFNQTYQNIAVRLTAGNASIPVSRALLKGKKLEFTLDRELGPVEAGAKFIGDVEKNRIRGKFILKSRSGDWNAKRTL